MIYCLLLFTQFVSSSKDCEKQEARSELYLQLKGSYVIESERAACQLINIRPNAVIARDMSLLPSHLVSFKEEPFG